MSSFRLAYRYPNVQKGAKSEARIEEEGEAIETFRTFYVDRRPMTKNQRLDFAYTLEGKPVLRGYIVPVKDGICFGIKSPDRRDIHLTIMYKDGKIRTHIKESGAELEYVYGRNYTPEILLSKLEARIKRWIKPYHPNHVAWIMTPYLKKKVNNAISEDVGGEKHIKLEGIYGQIMLDFWNRRRWKRVHISDILGSEKGLGFRVDKGRAFMVLPLDNKMMLKFTERQSRDVLRLALDYLGFLELFEYIDRVDS